MTRDAPAGLLAALGARASNTAEGRSMWLVEVATPWWAARLDRTELRAAQVSARRGDLHLRLEGDEVTVAGQAVTVLCADLVV